MLETVQSIDSVYGVYFRVFDVISVAIFTVEYLSRIWTAVEMPFLRQLPDWRSRLKFARRPDLLIDLFAILPFYLSFLLPFDLRFLRVLRLFRFLKLSRYSPAMHTLMRVMVNERRTLAGALMLVMTAILFASSGIYYLEHEAQPDKFGSIPESAWWAVVTLATVGYGDVTPITPFGRLFAGVVILFGLVVIALPIAIIANGYAQEAGRRDFVLSWSLISRIPLFAELDAASVAELMKILHAHNYPPGHDIIGKGDAAEAMYFVASGKIKVEHADGEHVAATGDFFGEQDMLNQDAAGYAAKTLSRTRLLKLYAEDFGRLSVHHPEIGAKIRKGRQKPANVS